MIQPLIVQINCNRLTVTALFVEQVDVIVKHGFHLPNPQYAKHSPAGS